jgi:hypothetical protein
MRRFSLTQPIDLPALNDGKGAEPVDDTANGR